MKGKRDGDISKTVRTSVSIPAERYADLRRVAERKRVSVAWVVRDAIERYLDRRGQPDRRGR